VIIGREVLAPKKDQMLLGEDPAQLASGVRRSAFGVRRSAFGVRRSALSETTGGASEPLAELGLSHLVE
jgi:hypothetical protein